MTSPPNCKFGWLLIWALNLLKTGKCKFWKWFGFGTAHWVYWGCLIGEWKGYGLRLRVWMNRAECLYRREFFLPWLICCRPWDWVWSCLPSTGKSLGKKTYFWAIWRSYLLSSLCRFCPKHQTTRPPTSYRTPSNSPLYLSHSVHPWIDTMISIKWLLLMRIQYEKEPFLRESRFHHRTFWHHLVMIMVVYLQEFVIFGRIALIGIGGRFSFLIVRNFVLCVFTIGSFEFRTSLIYWFNRISWTTFKGFLQISVALKIFSPKLFLRFKTQFKFALFILFYHT